MALGLSGTMAVVVALFILRVRREERRVPSTWLWRAIVEDPPANAPWQPPRPSMLLFLQLVALAALIAALARPFLLTDAPAGEHLVLILDRSASMAARDVAPSRLAEAKRRLLEVVGGSPEAAVTVIAYDDEMQLLTAGETDAAVVRRAVERVHVSPRPGDATDAFAFASALARGTDAQVVLFSDGGFRVDDSAPRPPLAPFVPIGDSDANQAVTKVSLAAGGVGPPQAFIQVVNAASAPATRRVEVEVNGTLYDVRDLALPAHGREGYTIDLPGDVAAVQAHLTGDDALALDDTAWAVRPVGAQARVTLISPGNRFLETALNLLPSVEAVDQITPEHMNEPYGLADVAVLDGLLPDRLPPGNLLVIGPQASLAAGQGVGPTEEIAVAGSLEAPGPQVKGDDPLTQGAELDQMALLRATALDLGAAWQPLVTTDVGGKTWPLLARGTLQGRRALVLAFDLRASDLPLRPAFPLLVARAIEELAPSTLGGLPASVPAGDPLALRLSPRAVAVEGVTPRGSRRRLTLRGPEARFSDTSEPGIYQVLVTTDTGEDRAAFAVNVAAAAEADIRPRAVVASTPRGEDRGPETPVARGRREVWWPLALAGLGILVAEWGVYHRTTLGRLMAQLRRASPS
ncbi:MAG: VWA domain-containing protein [Anaerolineae bacterium]